MRPYFAIIKDSFREAFHSRVLWVVLVIISLFLLAVSPLTFRQTLTVGLNADEVKWPAFVAALEKAKSGQGNRGAQRIWSLMSSAGQDAVEKYKPLPAVPKFPDIRAHEDAIRPIMDDLTTILKRDDLYQSTSFTSASLRMEGKELVRRDKELAPDERQRLNRLLLESALGDAVATSDSTSLQLRMAWFDMFPPLPISKPMLVTTVRRLLPFLVDKGLLAIGLMIAIIVTAPAIPQMFDPGSLHLLLSKPASRSLLYVSKFFGSCAFVLLCATYLFIGMYLLLGARWAVWEPRLLWCIPIYTFVFAVYYSVAALAALIWRNVIVSILVAIVFWALCFTVGISKQMTEASLNKYRVRKLVPVEDGLLAVDGTNTPFAWDTKHNRWNMALLSNELRDIQPLLTTVAQLPPMLGPVYDPQEKRVLAAMVSINNGQQLLCTATAADGFAHREGPAAPLQTLLMMNEPNGQPLIITGNGIFRPQGDLGKQPDEVKFLGYKIPFTSTGPLRDAGPSPSPVWDDPFNATFGPDGALFVYSRGKLQRLTKDKDGKYQVEKTEKFEGKNQRRALMAASQAGLLLGQRAGKLELRDPETFEIRRTFEPTPHERIRGLAGSPDGQWLAILMEGRKLWLLKSGEQQLQLARVGGQGDLSAIEFTRDNKLLVADYVDRVTEYDLSKNERTRRFAPPLHMQTIAYHYVIQPIYTICPKPGEFYRTVTHLLLENNDAPANGEQEEGDQNNNDPPRAIRSPWQPVYSSLAFMCVMLLLGCIYMERQEF